MKVVPMSKHFTQVAGIIVCSLLASFSAIAQDDKHKPELRAMLSQLKSFSAGFVQEVKDINGELLQRAEGKITLQQPQRLHWEVLPPNEGLLIADGETLWHVDPFVEQVIAVDQKSAVQDHPIMLLAEPDSQRWDDYSVSFEDDSYVIYPLSKQQSVKQFNLHFDKYKMLSHIKIIDQQEQTNWLYFSNAQSNIAIPSDTFTFALPEGFDLDDQR